MRRFVSYAKIMQTESRASSLLERFAEVQLILYKDTKEQQQMQERIAFSACAAVLFLKIFPLSTVPLQTLL